MKQKTWFSHFKKKRRNKKNRGREAFHKVNKVGGVLDLSQSNKIHQPVAEPGESTENVFLTNDRKNK